MPIHSKARNRATALAGALMATLFLAAARPASAQQPKPPLGGVMVNVDEAHWNFKLSGYFYMVNNTRNVVSVFTDSDWGKSTGTAIAGMIGPRQSLLQGMRQIDDLSKIKITDPKKSPYPQIYFQTIANGRANSWAIRIQQTQTKDAEGDPVNWVYWVLEDNGSQAPFVMSDSLVLLPSGACAYTYAYSENVVGGFYYSSSAAIVSQDIAVNLIMQGSKTGPQPVVLMISESGIMPGGPTYQYCSSTAP